MMLSSLLQLRFNKKRASVFVQKHLCYATSVRCLSLRGTQIYPFFAPIGYRPKIFSCTYLRPKKIRTENFFPVRISCVLK